MTTTPIPPVRTAPASTLVPPAEESKAGVEAGLDRFSMVLGKQFELTLAASLGLVKPPAKDAATVEPVRAPRESRGAGESERQAGKARERRAGRAKKNEQDKAEQAEHEEAAVARPRDPLGLIPPSQEAPGPVADEAAGQRHDDPASASAGQKSQDQKAKAAVAASATAKDPESSPASTQSGAQSLAASTPVEDRAMAQGRTAGRERAGSGDTSAPAAPAGPAPVMAMGAAGSTSGGAGGANAESAGSGRGAIPGLNSAGRGPLAAGFDRIFQLRSMPVSKSSQTSAASREPEEAVTAQLAKGLAAVFRQRGGSITLRLMPDALGAIRVQLQMDQSTISAQIDVASESTKALMVKGIEHLRSALESQGLNVDRLQIALIDEHGTPRPLPGPDPATSRPDDARPDLGQQQSSSSNAGGGGSGQGAGEGGQGAWAREFLNQDVIADEAAGASGQGEIAASGLLVLRIDTVA